MFEFKKIYGDTLRVAIQNTAEKMGVNVVTIEKDYWVCFILNYLFNSCEYKDAFAFKGGTSLSKCFSLINRFSEDIDLILDWTVLGYEKDEPWFERSKTKQDKFNKESNSKTEKFLENVLLGIMKKDLKELIDDKFDLYLDADDKQTIHFEYPRIFKSEYLVDSVRLEIGSLAAWTPSEDASIKPYILDFYPKLFDGNEIIVKTVSPERTFWEKATILHHEANRPSNLKIPIRYARHYYDMYQIANSEYKDTSFNKVSLLEKVATFKRKFYPRKWAKYEEANIEKLRLVPDEYRFKEIEEDYNNMQEMFFDNFPSFEEIITELKILEREIHEIK